MQIKHFIALSTQTSLCHLVSSPCGSEQPANANEYTHLYVLSFKCSAHFCNDNRDSVIGPMQPKGLKTRQERMKTASLQGDLLSSLSGGMEEQIHTDTQQCAPRPGVGHRGHYQITESISPSPFSVLGLWSSCSRLSPAAKGVSSNHMIMD